MRALKENTKKVTSTSTRLLQLNVSQLIEAARSKAKEADKKRLAVLEELDALKLSLADSSRTADEQKPEPEEAVRAKISEYEERLKEKEDELERKDEVASARALRDTRAVIADGGTGGGDEPVRAMRCGGRRRKGSEGEDCLTGDEQAEGEAETSRRNVGDEIAAGRCGGEGAVDLELQDQRAEFDAGGGGGDQREDEAPPRLTLLLSQAKLAEKEQRLKEAAQSAEAEAEAELASSCKALRESQELNEELRAQVREAETRLADSRRQLEESARQERETLEGRMEELDRELSDKDGELQHVHEVKGREGAKRGEGEEPTAGGVNACSGAGGLSCRAAENSRGKREEAERGG
eukprot:215946-Hanusia_phi.AAC.2